MPTCREVRLAISCGIGFGVPAASASSCARAALSIAMYHQAAASMVGPTVSRPWFCRIAAFFDPSACAILRPSSASSTTPENGSNSDVVLVEGAGILGQRIEQAAERRPGLAVGRMRVGGRDHVRMRGVDRRVNHEAGLVDRLVADQDVAIVVDELKVRHLDLAEMLRQRIDPEPLGKFRIAHGDMAARP